MCLIDSFEADRVIARNLEEEWDSGVMSFAQVERGKSDCHLGLNFFFSDLCTGMKVRVYFHNGLLDYTRYYDDFIAGIDFKNRTFRLSSFNCDFDRFGYLKDVEGCTGIVAYFMPEDCYKSF